MRYLECVRDSACIRELSSPEKAPPLEYVRLFCVFHVVGNVADSQALPYRGSREGGGALEIWCLTPIARSRGTLKPTRIDGFTHTPSCASTRG